MQNSAFSSSNPLNSQSRIPICGIINKNAAIYRVFPNLWRLLSTFQLLNTITPLQFLRKQDWAEAVFWYASALDMCEDDEGGDFDGLQDDPRYMVLAREAEMYQEGGFNLTADPQKAGERGCILDPLMGGLMQCNPNYC